MDCKVICGFDLLVVECFTVCIFLSSESIEKLTEHCLGLKLIEGFWEGQPTGWGYTLYFWSTNRYTYSNLTIFISSPGLLSTISLRLLFSFLYVHLYIIHVKYLAGCTRFSKDFYHI